MNNFQAATDITPTVITAADITVTDITAMQLSS